MPKYSIFLLSYKSFILGAITAKLSILLTASSSCKKKFWGNIVSISKYKTYFVLEFLIPQLIPAPLPRFLFFIISIEILGGMFIWF